MKAAKKVVKKKVVKKYSSTSPLKKSIVSYTPPEKIVKKKKRIIKPKVKMVSYSMRMVIPTGDFANIQPEIVVKGGSMDEAHAFVAPHMNKLWKEYFNISKRKVEPKPVPKPAPVTPTPVQPNKVSQQAQTPVTPAPVQPNKVSQQAQTPVTPTPTPVEPSPISSVALTKATQAIQSCLSMDALELIIQQVKVSVKLTEQDKIDLAGIIMEKENELKVAILTSEEPKTDVGQ